MHFNKHMNLEGTHAFLGASKYSWVNYDEDKLIDSYRKHMQKQLGTELHDLAQKLIETKTKLPDDGKTLSRYVNDSIGFDMTPEVMLKPDFIHYCFGTADAISFRNRKLRIFDLKTGTSKVSFLQLVIYAALFCLEYDEHPNDIDIELRIYQNDDVEILEPEKAEILHVMAKIKRFDTVIREMQGGYTIG